MTIQQAYQQLLFQLYEIYDNREAANIADWVLEHVTGQRKIERILYKDLPVNENQQQQLTAITEALIQHKPVQYVLNEAWFFDWKFYVNEAVLIPRPETEELVNWVITDVKQAIQNASQPKTAITVLDIGTGSGCIPISIKKKMPFAVVSALDVSPAALEVASKNVKNLDAAVTLEALDFLDEEARNKLGTYEIIISNPPYIKASEQEAMNKNVLSFEPHLALFVPDENALVFYEAIADFASTHLAANGKIYMEINEQLGEEVINLFIAKGFRNVELKKDMQGKDRMVKCTFNSTFK